jgi:hypothetical protein
MLFLCTFSHRFRQQLGHPLRVCASRLPFFAYNQGYGARWAGRRADLLDDADQRCFDVSGFWIENDEAVQDTAFQFQAHSIGFLIPCALPGPKVARS